MNTTQYIGTLAESISMLDSILDKSVAGANRVLRQLEDAHRALAGMIQYIDSMLDDFAATEWNLSLIRSPEDNGITYENVQYRNANKAYTEAVDLYNAVDTVLDELSNIRRKLEAIDTTPLSVD